MIKEIKILSQKEAKRIVPEIENVAVISIVDKKNKTIHWGENVKYLFNMKFDDTDNFLNDSSATKKSFKGLKDFIDNLDVDVLVIHCYAGISRSSAVAAAIGEYLGLKMKIWTNPKYDPNVLVYELVKKELLN